ncbi:testis-expressed protein 9-like [Papaver somniferum]|uniref:testis-expressed protein 9-like n=1 Tax=Papaver somniferum TaxID=3469 RepID=UPI000E701788|nr:testis-expressed protein 9-like [Papaver somniferum]
MKRKWDIEKDHVENLRQRISNKDGKIDRQEAEIQQLQEELDKYRLFEYVPEEIDNLRTRLGMFQRLASDKTLLADNLESQNGSLRLQNRYLHEDRRRILREKVVAEQSNRDLIERTKGFDKLSTEQGRAKDLERDVHNLGQEVEQWKKAEGEMKVNLQAAESRSEQLSQQIVDERNAHQSDLAEEIKAGVNEYIAQKRREVSQRKGGAGAAPPRSLSRLL